MRFRRGEVPTKDYRPAMNVWTRSSRSPQGVFTTVTGHPNHGKSAWVDQIHVNMAVREDWNFGIWSPRGMRLRPYSQAIELFQETRSIGHEQRHVGAEDRGGASPRSKHATFITSDGGPDTMESILERMTGAVMRCNIKAV